MDKTAEAQKKILMVLVAALKAYPQSGIDEEGLKVYASNLSEVYTPHQVELAMSCVMRRCKFFPSIAEICEVAEEQRKKYRWSKHNLCTYRECGMKPLMSDLKVVAKYEGCDVKALSSGQQG